MSRFRGFEFALLLTATAALACALASGASGATIAVTGGTAVFRAAHGEANDLQIGFRGGSDPCGPYRRVACAQPTWARR